MAIITMSSETSRNTISRMGHKDFSLEWTRQDAENWATATIQSIQDNNGIYIDPEKPHLYNSDGTFK